MGEFLLMLNGGCIMRAHRRHGKQWDPHNREWNFELLFELGMLVTLKDVMREA